MIARYFFIPLLAAIYTSGWWSYFVFDLYKEFPVAILILVIVGVVYLPYIFFCFAQDMEKN